MQIQRTNRIDRTDSRAGAGLAERSSAEECEHGRVGQSGGSSDGAERKTG